MLIGQALDCRGTILRRSCARARGSRGARRRSAKALRQRPSVSVVLAGARTPSRVGVAAQPAQAARDDAWDACVHDELVELDAGGARRDLPAPWPLPGSSEVAVAPGPVIWSPPPRASTTTSFDAATRGEDVGEHGQAQRMASSGREPKPNLLADPPAARNDDRGHLRGHHPRGEVRRSQRKLKPSPR